MTAAAQLTRVQLARVCRDHRAYLHGFAGHLTRGVDADDLLQDALVAALRRPGPLPSDSEARAWLSTVMRHRQVDRCRRRAAAARLTAALARLPSADADEPWWTDLTTAEIEAEVAALPAALAAPFSLFAFERASYKQIAARLGLPIATVGTRILRARARLRERLTARHAVTRPVTA
jgi:RNA polymerase sigma-70 factor (ECF subfamily)